MIVEDGFVDGDFECEFYTFILFLPEGNLRSSGRGGGGGGQGRKVRYFGYGASFSCDVS